jgi:hypothetical protein
VTGVTGGNYGPVTITGAGTSHLICTFAKPITGPDIVTITVTFAGTIVGGPATLDVLPGDVNDDGVVNSTDGVQILRSFTPANPYNIFNDLNGDGAVNMEDFDLYRPQIGTVLPSLGVAPNAVVFTPGLGGLASQKPVEQPPALTPPIDGSAVAAQGMNPQPSAVVVDTVLGATNEDALDPSQVRGFLKDIEAKRTGRASTTLLTHDRHRAEGAHGKRVAVSYHPNSSLNEIQPINDSLLMDPLKKGAHS